MLFRYFTEKLLGLQDILIENIEEIDGSIHIYCKLELKMHEYPVCGKHTDKIHDYREQVIKDIPAFGKFVSQEEQIPFFRVTPTLEIEPLFIDIEPLKTVHRTDLLTLTFSPDLAVNLDKKENRVVKRLLCCGSPNWARTSDIMINSHAVYLKKVSVYRHFRTF